MISRLCTLLLAMQIWIYQFKMESDYSRELIDLEDKLAKTRLELTQKRSKVHLMVLAGLRQTKGLELRE